LAKFNLAADKLLLVRSSLVRLDAGEIDTNDEDLIKALRSALYVDEVKPKKTKSEPAE
jgi:hypothetical protein